MKDETTEWHILLGNNSSEFDELDEHQIEDFESIYFENLIQYKKIIYFIILNLFYFFEIICLMFHIK